MSTSCGIPTIPRRPTGLWWSKARLAARPTTRRLARDISRRGKGKVHRFPSLPLGPVAGGHEFALTAGVEWVADEELPGSRVERWVSVGATIVAPVTVLSALLFYFGYVSSRSQYAYFGVDVDTIGLSTQDYVIRSPQPLLVPLLVLTLAGAGILMLDAAVRRRTASAVADAANEANAAKPELGPAQYVEQIRHIAHISVIFGLALLTAGVVLLFTYALVRGWAFYGIVTPLLLGLGVALIAYASRVLSLCNINGRGRRQPPRRILDPPMRGLRIRTARYWCAVAPTF